MEIAFITPKMYAVLADGVDDETFGGAEVALSIVAKRLAQDPNIDVSVLVADYGQDKTVEIDAIKLIKCIHFEYGTARNAYSLIRSMYQLSADVFIQRTLTIGSTLIATYCFCTGKKFLYWVAHDNETDGGHPLCGTALTSFMVKLMYRLASHVIVQNDYEKNQLEKIIPSSKVTVLKKAIPVSSKPPNLEGSTRYDGIWVGRCDEWKNPDAMVRLAEANSTRRFLMICPPALNKSAEYERFQAQAAGCSNLEIRGRTTNAEVLDFMAQSRVFCITSTQEGDWPVVVLEAASQRLPILSLSLAYDDLIDTYSAGYACDSDETLFHGMFNRLMSDSKLRSNMGDGALDYVMEKHSVDIQHHKLMKIINGL